MTYKKSSNTFQGNYAELSGGAVYAAFYLFVPTLQELAFSLTNTSFKYNHAGKKGGALFCDNNRDFKLKLSGVDFISNKASNGGAVYAENFIIDFNSGTEDDIDLVDSEWPSYSNVNPALRSYTISIVGNSANEKGGGIFLGKSILKISGNNTVLF